MSKSNRTSIGSSSSGTYYGSSLQSAHYSNDYWDKLFKDTDYYDLYKSILNSYSVDAPNTFWGALTGQNKTNAYQHEMKKRDELSALAEKMYNENYQSPVSDVERLRDAGLNPDLSGLSGASASQLSPNGIPEGVFAENGLHVTASLASVAMTAVGMAQNIMGSMSTALSLESQRLDNLQKMDSFALSYILDNVEPLSVVDGALASDIRTDIISSSRSFGRKFYGFNNSQSRRFQDSVARKLDSPEFFEKYYGFMSRGSSNRKDYISNTSGNLYSQEDETMRILFGELISAQNKASLADSKAQKIKSDYNAKLYGSMSAEDAAYRFNEENVTAKENAVTYRTESFFYKQVAPKLHKAFEDGNLFAGAVLAMLNTLRSTVKFSRDAATSIIK